MAEYAKSRRINRIESYSSNRNKKPKRLPSVQSIVRDGQEFEFDKIASTERRRKKYLGARHTTHDTVPLEDGLHAGAVSDGDGRHGCQVQPVVIGLTRARSGGISQKEQESSAKAHWRWLLLEEWKQAGENVEIIEVYVSGQKVID